MIVTMTYEVARRIVDSSDFDHIYIEEQDEIYLDGTYTALELEACITILKYHRCFDPDDPGENRMVWEEDDEDDD